MTGPSEAGGPRLSGNPYPPADRTRLGLPFPEHYWRRQSQMAQSGWEGGGDHE